MSAPASSGATAAAPNATPNSSSSATSSSGAIAGAAGGGGSSGATSAPTATGGAATTKSGTVSSKGLPANVEIRDVWAGNLEESMKIIREVVQRKCYVAMDTEYPGVVARPIGSFTTSTDYQYQTLRCNVDLLRIIQLGVAFFNEDGSYMSDIPVWQFNFKFSLGEDMYAQDSIEILKQAGIDFAKHEEMGIEVAKFGELLVPSGLVLVDHVKWVSFHGSSDFGYLLKVLTCAPLPAEEDTFFDLLHTYFPCTYDLKHVALDFDKMGGLSRLAEDLQVERIGTMHQAGSDALLTAATFFKMVEVFFDGKVENAARYSGHLYGLGNASNSGLN